MAPSLKAKVLLAKIQNSRSTNDPAFSVIMGVNRALDDLTQPTEGNLDQEERHRLIAETVAAKYPYRIWHGDDPRNEPKKAKQLAQDVLGGAIVTGNLPLVRSLLAARDLDLPDINTKSFYFGLPLTTAAAFGHLHIVQYLLGRGANPRAVDRKWCRSNKWSMYPWEPKTGKLSVDRRRCVFQSPEGSALTAAALGGHQEVVDYLLQPHCRIPPLELEYSYALAAAARGGHLAIIRSLLQVLKNVTGHGLSGVPGTRLVMLWEAVRFDHRELVRELLDSRAKVDARPDPVVHGDSGTALEIAARVGNAEILRLLLTVGAFESDARGRAQLVGDAIKRAARGGHDEAVHVLIEWGGDSSSAMTSAAASGQVRLVRDLAKKYPDILEREIESTGGHTADREAIVTTGQDRRRLRRTLGRQALEDAIFSSNPAMILLLAELGVSFSPVDLQDQDGTLLDLVPRTTWMKNFLFSERTEEVDDEQGSESFDNILKLGGVYVFKRTWEWVGKY
jgi:ankyrin repeat protein